MSGRHNNNSAIYVTAKYQCVPKLFVKMRHICVCLMALVQSKIFLELYISMWEINKNYKKIFKRAPDELAVRVRWDTPLDLTGEKIPELSRPLVVA